MENKIDALDQQINDTISTIQGEIPKLALKAASVFPVQIINQSTVMTDAELLKMVGPLQTQITRDVSPVWGVGCNLEFVPKGAAPSDKHWWIGIFDNSDDPGALGYHDLTTTGMPLGKVFAASDIKDGSSISVTISHELIEMLIDPFINLAAVVENMNGGLQLVAYEANDPVEADRYGYDIDGTLVSDFVYPAWFEATPQNSKPTAKQYDHLGLLSHPLSLMPGGYMQVMNLNGSPQGWQQINAQRDTPPSYSTRAKLGSRRNRRNTPKGYWLNSVLR